MSAEFLELPSLIIDPETLDESNDAISFNLKVPAHARKAGKASFWTELLDIYGAHIEKVDDDENPGRWRVVVNAKVAAESTDDTNIGRPVTISYLINPEALKGGASKEKTMALMSIGRMKQLLTAAGHIPEDTSGYSLDLKEFFAGEAPAVIGSKVYALFRNKKDAQYPQDITHFDSLESGESDAA